MCKVNVVLPDDSGPKISTMRPRGKPPMPSAMSRPSEPVGMTWTSRSTGSLPRRMIAPLPNCLSIAASARSIAFVRSEMPAGGVDVVSFVAIVKSSRLVAVPSGPAIVRFVPQLYRSRLTVETRFGPVFGRFEDDSMDFAVHGTGRFCFAFEQCHPIDARVTEHLFGQG